MENLKAYLTREGWKKDLAETVEDISKFYRFITIKTPEKTKAKERAKLDERILGYVGLPQGVLHNLNKLRSYCIKNRIGMMEVVGCKVNDVPPKGWENENDVHVAVGLGKGDYELIYDDKENYKGMTSYL